MSLGRVRCWGRQRTEVEWMALAAAAVAFGYVGWDASLWDARLQLLLHLLAVGAVAGLAVIGLRGELVPRTRIDLPILGLLAAFALATASALNVGMSLRAMAVVAATAAMLPVALVAIRHRPTWVGVLASVPVLLLATPTLLVLIARRVEWVLAGAPGLPPIRLAAEGTPFGSIAVPPFVMWPAWALAGLIEPRGPRRTIRAGLVAVGVPLTILSGSRSAWLAIGVTLLVAGVPWAWRRRATLRSLAVHPSPRSLLIALSALAGVAAMAAFIAPRVTAVTSLIYRAGLWRDTLNAWGTDPLLGIGPGFMPYARQAAAPDFTFPIRQPHSHNIPLGILGDAGIVGLLAAAILVATVAWVAGPWRSRTPTGRAAALVLLGLAVGGLFEDLTFLPNFNLLVVALVAVALADSGAVRWTRLDLAGWRRPATLAAGSVIAVVLLAAMVVADAGAIAYRAGVDAAAREDWAGATERLARSTQIDAWHPAGPKALAVAADGAGLPELARDAAERATLLNPGDGPSWTNLALLCAELGDTRCQRLATERAVATAGYFGAELINAALSYEALGDSERADDAYLRSLLSQRLTALATDWPRRIDIGDGAVADPAGAQFDLHLLLARWLMGEPIEPGRYGDPSVRALAHGMLDERSAADEWIRRAIAAAPELIPTWDTAIVLRQHWGESVEDELRIAAVVRGRPFPGREASAPPGLTFDIGSFRAYPRDELVASARRLRTEPPFPWALERTLP